MTPEPPGNRIKTDGARKEAPSRREKPSARSRRGPWAERSATSPRQRGHTGPARCGEGSGRAEPSLGPVSTEKGSGGRRMHGAVGAAKRPWLRVRWEDRARRRRRGTERSAAAAVRLARRRPRTRGCGTRGAARGRAAGAEAPLRGARPRRHTPTSPRRYGPRPGELLEAQAHAPRRSRGLQRRAGAEPGAECLVEGSSAGRDGRGRGRHLGTCPRPAPRRGRAGILPCVGWAPNPICRE